MAALGFGVAAPAGAEPAGSTGVGTQDLGVLNEQYNLARLRLDRASAEVRQTEQRLAATKTRADGVRALVRARSASLYEGAAAGGVTAVLATSSVNDFARRTQYVSAAAEPDRALLAELSRTLDRLTVQEQSATAARDRLRAQADAAAASRRKLMAEAAAAAARPGPAGDGAGPVGTPRALLVASSASGSTARTGAAPVSTPAPTAAPQAPATPPPTSAPTGHPNPPPASSRGAVAVAFARAQIGKPYVFNTAGPATFDCSGLTMAAWHEAGVSMAHYSGAQAAAFPRVSYDQLQPGDIVVFYPDFHHVGLYIGGGMMIHAPRTGELVQTAPAWRTTFQFGVRPG